MSQSGNIILKAAWTNVSAFLVKAINTLTDSVISQIKEQTKLYTNICKQNRVQKNRKAEASQPSSKLASWQLLQCPQKKFISKLDEINM